MPIYATLPGQNSGDVAHGVMQILQSLISSEKSEARLQSKEPELTPGTPIFDIVEVRAMMLRCRPRRCPFSLSADTPVFRLAHNLCVVRYNAYGVCRADGATWPRCQV
jgi:hypothetical protein